MFNEQCPICRGRKIESNQCMRCSADLTELRYLEGKVSALYCSIFIAIKDEKYSIAMDVISNLKKLRNDSFIRNVEIFLNHLIAVESDKQTA